jgi:hypothetical protein
MLTRLSSRTAKQQAARRSHTNGRHPLGSRDDSRQPRRHVRRYDTQRRWLRARARGPRANRNRRWLAIPACSQPRERSGQASTPSSPAPSKPRRPLGPGSLESTAEQHLAPDLIQPRFGSYVLRATTPLPTLELTQPSGKRRGFSMCSRSDYRVYAVLRRHPAALVSMARYYACASLEGARRGYRTARTELAESVPPHAVDGVLAAYRTEGYKLAATARAVEAPPIASVRL